MATAILFTNALPDGYWLEWSTGDRRWVHHLAVRREAGEGANLWDEVAMRIQHAMARACSNPGMWCAI